MIHNTQEDKVYTVLNGTIKMVDLDNVPRPSEDPFWLCEYIEGKINKGDSVLDAGSGNGIIALILGLHRGADIEGVEIDNMQVSAARMNARLNGLKNVHFSNQNFLDNDFNERYMHVVSNPPYHNTEKGFNSENGQKLVAHGAGETQMVSWLKKCIRLTKTGGTCTLIHHASNIKIFEDVLRLYNHQITPIKTHPDKPAKRVIIHIQR